MNSLPDNRLEEKIDQLLASSVSPGSEPEGLYIGPMPRRPEFHLMPLVYALAGVCILGFFIIQWVLNQNIEEVDFVHMFSWEGIASFMTGVSSGTLAALLGLAAAVSLILPEKLKLLYRTSCL